jgi:hypothetical protein
LQSLTGRIEKSLRTSDRRQAEVLALPMIAEHKAKLLQARPRLEISWVHEYEPGREHVGPDGARIIATARELIYLNHNGTIVRTTPNGSPAHQLVGGPLTVRSLAEAFIKADFGDGSRRPTVATKKWRRRNPRNVFATCRRHRLLRARSANRVGAVQVAVRQAIEGKRP